MATLPEIRTLVGSTIWKDILPNAVEAAKPGSGTVLVVTGVSVHPGMGDAYRDRVKQIKTISDRLKLRGTGRMWQATLAGPNTGNIAVGVEYPDLPSYVADQATLDADKEWQGVIGGLGEIRTLRGRWLYQEITP